MWVREFCLLLLGRAPSDLAEAGRLIRLASGFEYLDIAHTYSTLLILIPRLLSKHLHAFCGEKRSFIPHSLVFPRARGTVVCHVLLEAARDGGEVEYGPVVFSQAWQARLSPLRRPARVLSPCVLSLVEVSDPLLLLQILHDQSLDLQTDLEVLSGEELHVISQGLSILLDFELKVLLSTGPQFR